MTKKSILQLIFIGLMFICLSASAAFAQTTAFTYQGKLTNNGTPATGTYEMRFTLHDQAVGGFEIGTPKTIPNIAVTNGVFTVVITVGDWTFTQNDRFIEIAVRPQGDVNPFTVLAPLQQITHTPKAIFANSAGFAGFSASSGNAIHFSGLGIEQFVLKNVNGEIVAPRFENLAADPEPASAANTGQVYFNTTTNSLMVSNGTAWINLKPRIQTFYATTPSGAIACNATAAIRSVNFTKISDASRLRITYRDTAEANFLASVRLFVEGRIDGTVISDPTILRMRFELYLTNIGVILPDIYSASHPFTLIGYANNVASGNHSLSFNYTTAGGTPTACFRESEFLIEIEEVP